MDQHSVVLLDPFNKSSAMLLLYSEEMSPGPETFTIAIHCLATVAISSPTPYLIILGSLVRYFDRRLAVLPKFD